MGPGGAMRGAREGRWGPGPREIPQEHPGVPHEHPRRSQETLEARKSAPAGPRRPQEFDPRTPRDLSGGHGMGFHRPGRCKPGRPGAPGSGKTAPAGGLGRPKKGRGEGAGGPRRRKDGPRGRLGGAKGGPEGGGGGAREGQMGLRRGAGSPPPTPLPENARFSTTPTKTHPAPWSLWIPIGGAIGIRSHIYIYICPLLNDLRGLLGGKG